MATALERRKSEIEKATQAEIKQTREIQRKLQKQKELGIEYPEAEKELEEHIVATTEAGKEAIKELERAKPKARPQTGVPMAAMPDWWPDYIAENPDAYPEMPEGITPKSIWQSAQYAQMGGRHDVVGHAKEIGFLVEVGAEGSGDYTTASYYNSLSPELQNLMNEVGTANFKAEGLAQGLLTEVGPDKDAIPTETYEKLSDEAKAAIDEGGIESLNEYFEEIAETLAEYEGVSMEEILEALQDMTADSPLYQALIEMGYTPEELQAMSILVQSGEGLGEAAWLDPSVIENLSEEAQSALGDYLGYDVVAITELLGDGFSTAYPEGLTPAEQKEFTDALLFLGVDPKNLQDVSEFVQSNTKLETGEWVNTEFYDALPAPMQKKLSELGVDKFKDFTDDLEKKLSAEGANVEKIATTALGISGTPTKKQQEQIHLTVAMYGSDEDAVGAIASLYGLSPEAYPQFRETADFVKNSVQLTTGEWVGKDSYLAMPEEEQVRLNELGVKGYQKWFDDNHVKLSSGEYIGKADFDAMPEDYQKKLTQLGSMGKFNTWFKDNHIKIGEDYIAKESWKAMSSENQARMKQLGVSGYQDWFKTHHIEIGDGGYMVKADFDALPKKTQEALKKDGYKAIDNLHLLTKTGKWIKTTGLTPELEYKKLVSAGIIPPNTVLLGKDEEGNLQYATVQAEGSNPLFNRLWADAATNSPITGISQLDSAVSATGALNEVRKATLNTTTGMFVAEMIVPGLWARHWNSVGVDGKPMLANWEKGLYLTLDVATVIPMIRWAGAASRTAGILGKAGRIGRIAKVARMTPIAMIEGTAAAIRHPVRAGKIISDPAEILLRYHRVPIESLTTGWTTMKVSIHGLGGKMPAVRARELIMKAAAEGKPLAVNVTSATGKVHKLELSNNILSQVVDGAVFHGTDDIRIWLRGGRIGVGNASELYFAPNLAERFAIQRAFGTAPKGAVKGALIITDPSILKKLSTSSGLGAGRVEIEAVLKQGIKIPTPSQILVTRGTTGEKLMLLIIGPKLSPIQIAKMKILAPKAIMKQIFGVEWKVSKASKLMDKLVDTQESLLGLERQLKAATTDATRATLRTQIASLSDDATRLARQVEEAAFAATPPAPPNLGAIMRSGKSFYDMVYEGWASEKPATFAEYLRSQPRAERTVILRSIPPRQRAEIRRLLVLQRAQLRHLVRVEVSRAQRVPRISRPVSPARVSTPVRVTAPPRIPTTPRIPRVPRIAEPPRTPKPPRTPEPPRIVVPPRTDVPPKIPPPLPPLPRDEEERYKRLTDQEKKGSVAWRQGKWYILIYPPYGKEHIIYSEKPFPGIRMTTGAGSAYRSIGQPKKGILPPLIERDMGIVDIRITTPKKGKDRGRKPKIHFTADPKQETTLSGVK